VRGVHKGAHLDAQTVSNMMATILQRKFVNKYVTTSICRDYSSEVQNKNILKSHLEDVKVIPTPLPKFIWERSVKMFPNRVALVSIY